MSDEELVKQALAELGDVVRCRCHEAYKGRGLHDPDCQCDSAEALATVTKHIEALTEQLEAARADAKEAEAYAEELEGDLTELCRQLLAAEDKLAKAVEAVDKAAALIEERHVVHMTAKGRNPKDYISEWSLIAKEVRAMLAELKGESHD